MDVEKERKRLQSFIIGTVVIMLFCLYLGLQYGNAVYTLIQQSTDGTYNISDVFSLMADHLTKPKYCFPTNGNSLVLFLVAGAIINLYRYTDYLRERNTMYGKEGGSAQFNVNYKGLIHDYVMSPKFLGEHFHKKYETVRASGGRKQCKKRNFSKEETAYAKKMSQIYSKNVYLSMDTSLTQLNLNTIVFGGSGAGKSRFFVKPNILQANSSYVVTDPSGELMADCGKYLQDKGYIVKCFNIEHMDESCRYNPFAYVYEDADILVMVQALINNIEGPKKGGSGDNKFWDETSQTLLTAICGYLFEVCHDKNEYLFEEETGNTGKPLLDKDGHKIPKRDADGNIIYKKRQAKDANGNDLYDKDGKPVMEYIPNPHWEGCKNFNNVLRLLNMADVSDDKKADEKDDLDLLFDDLEEANPSSYAVSQYKVIKQAGTGKTAQNIVISTTAIFARFFQLDKIANLTYKDELHLEEIGKRKYALFIVTPQGDTTYNFLASLLYTQLFNTLYHQGEMNAKERHTTSVRLDVPVRCLIDEAANIGVIPQFPEKLATMRKYGISACPIYQNQAQIKSLMKDDWETIVGNCDGMVFLGGIDSSTVKMVSERLGKGTINSHNNSVQFNDKGGSSTSISATGRELMTTTELEQMENDKCIVFLRSMKPFKDYKYPLEKHPAYKETGDCDEKNAFVPDWHLYYDRNLMRRIAVKRTSDVDYIKPDPAPGVTQAEVEQVKAEHNDNIKEVEMYKSEHKGVPKLDPTTDDIELEDFSEIKDPDAVFADNLNRSAVGRKVFG